MWINVSYIKQLQKGFKMPILAVIHMDHPSSDQTKYSWCSLKEYDKHLDHPEVGSGKRQTQVGVLVGFGCTPLCSLPNPVLQIQCLTSQVGPVSRSRVSKEFSSPGDYNSAQDTKITDWLMVNKILPSFLCLAKCAFDTLKLQKFV